MLVVVCVIRCRRLDDATFILFVVLKSKETWEWIANNEVVFRCNKQRKNMMTARSWELFYSLFKSSISLQLLFHFTSLQLISYLILDCFYDSTSSVNNDSLILLLLHMLWNNWNWIWLENGIFNLNGNKFSRNKTERINSIKSNKSTFSNIYICDKATAKILCYFFYF